MSLKSLLEYLKSARREGRRAVIHGDPAKGMEYNKINTTYRASKRVYSVDIARTPQIVKDSGGKGYNFDFVDVQAETYKVNQYNAMINYRGSRVHGRGR